MVSGRSMGGAVLPTTLLPVSPKIQYSGELEHVVGRDPELLGDIWNLPVRAPLLGTRNLSRDGTEPKGALTWHPGSRGHSAV